MVGWRVARCGGEGHGEEEEEEEEERRGPLLPSVGAAGNCVNFSDEDGGEATAALRERCKHVHAYAARVRLTLSP